MASLTITNFGAALTRSISRAPSERRAMNGKRLSLRDKGPIWVIYPMTDNKELQDPAYNQRLVWQLVKIEVK